MPIIHVNVRLYHLINITGVEAASDGYQLACTVTLEYRQQLCKPQHWYITGIAFIMMMNDTASEQERIEVYWLTLWQ